LTEPTITIELDQEIYDELCDIAQMKGTSPEFVAALILQERAADLADEVRSAAGSGKRRQN
jgi:hypothetical protein